MQATAYFDAPTNTWNTSTPPAPGWYAVSYDRDPDSRRYWDGSAWSAPCHAAAEQKYHDRARATPAESQDGIVWRSIDTDGTR